MHVEEEALQALLFLPRVSPERPHTDSLNIYWEHMQIKSSARENIYKHVIMAKTHFIL